MRISAINSYNNNYYKKNQNKPNLGINFGKNIGVFAGSFDPLNNGHLEMIEKGAKLFDSLIVLIAKNPEKKSFIPTEKRLELIKETLASKGLKNVTADASDGYTVNYAREHDAKYLLRGMRTNKDFDYESNIAKINKDLAPEIETVTLFSSDKNNNVSSSRVREYFFNNSTEFKNIVPKPISDYLLKLLSGGAK